MDTEVMFATAASVARAFGLGRVVGPLRPLPGLSHAPVWALSTDRGEWVVKAVGPARPDALRLERAARLAGIATARLIPGPVDELGVRVWARVPGVPPSLPANDEVAAWLGTTVATIGNLNLPATSTMDAEEHSTMDCRTLHELAGALGPPTVLCHRDINSRNILVTVDGPVLLDFENAGPQAPWWELVHHAFLLSCHDLGPEEPNPATIRAAVRAYRDHGGTMGPSDRTAFGGLAAGLLDWARHDPVAAAPRLPLIARSLDRWATLLKC